jgi:hypothetical protein
MRKILLATLLAGGLSLSSLAAVAGHPADDTNAGTPDPSTQNRGSTDLPGSGGHTGTSASRHGNMGNKGRTGKAKAPDKSTTSPKDPAAPKD